MRTPKKLSGFTLVELLVAMAIIAILIGLAVAGIALATRVSRDTERRKAVDNIRLYLEAYRSTNATYPTRSTTCSSTTTNVVCRNGSNIRVGTQEVEMKGAALASATPTTSGTTQYCYERTATGYTVGALLEDGSWYSALSTDTTAVCSTYTL